MGLVTRLRNIFFSVIGASATQAKLNQNLAEAISQINDAAPGQVYVDSRQSPEETELYLTAKNNKFQYVGTTSGAVPGAITYYLPPSENMVNMDGFYINDESQNADTYNITITCLGTAKIYGPGLSDSGETSLVISDKKGFRALLYVTEDTYWLIGSSEWLP